MALVSGLPPGSRSWVALHGPAALWTDTHELLAIVAELVDVGNVYLFEAFRKRTKTGAPAGRDRPPALRIPRPAREPPATTRSATPAQAPPEPAGPVSMSDPRAVRFFSGVARYHPREPTAAD